MRDLRKNKPAERNLKTSHGIRQWRTKSPDLLCCDPLRHDFNPDLLKDHRCYRPLIFRFDRANLPDHIHSADDLSEHRVDLVECASFGKSDEELARCGI